MSLNIVCYSSLCHSTIERVQVVGVARTAKKRQTDVGSSVEQIGSGLGHLELTHLKIQVGNAY